MTEQKRTKSGPAILSYLGIGFICLCIGACHYLVSVGQTMKLEAEHKYTPQEESSEIEENEESD